MNNILVVNVNWLGDAVFSTPFFKSLKKAYPQARLNVEKYFSAERMLTETVQIYEQYSRC